MDSLDRLHSELGLKHLNPTWAKLEILLGLLAAAIGWAVMSDAMGLFGEPSVLVCAGGIVLAVLGTYLAMAGHRSHLYQSQNRLAAWLAAKVTEQESSAPGA